MPSIFDQFVVFKPNLLMDELTFSGDFYEKLDKDYAGFKGHTLIAAHRFSQDWPSWEIHPEGDELVILLSGRAEFKLRMESGDRSVFLDSPGAYTVVPRNTWHTALVKEPTEMLFITPGEGTQNAVKPEAGE